MNKQKKNIMSNKGRTTFNIPQMNTPPQTLHIYPVTNHLYFAFNSGYSARKLLTRSKFRFKSNNHSVTF